MHLAKAVFLVATGVGLAAIGYAKEPEQRTKEKLICKSQTETGSIARRKKECFTKAEWDKIGEAHRRGWSRAIDDMRTRPAGN